MPKKLLLIFTALLWPLLLPKSAAATDASVTLAGKAYKLVPAASLLERLRRTPAGQVIELRDAAIKGPLFLHAEGLDTVRATLAWNQVHFLEEASFDQVVFAGDLRIEGGTFSNGLSCVDARFLATVDFAGSRFDKRTSFKRSHFAASAGFSDINFDESSSFIGADFGGQTSFARTYFQREAYFERARFAGLADFRDGHFGAITSFKEAHWQQWADFSGVRLTYRTIFWQSRFDGGASFDSARIRGEFLLTRLDAGGALTFKETIFKGPVSLDRATLAAATDFSGSHFEAPVDLSASTFGGPLRLRALFDADLDLQGTRGPLLDLGTSTDSTLADTAKIYLQDAHFQRLLAHWPQLAGRLAAKDSSANIAPIYQALIHHFRAAGRISAANACLVESLEHKRAGLSLTDPARYGLLLLGLSSQYGTNPGRLFVFAAVIILLGGLLFRLGSGHIGRQNEGGPPALLDCLLLSAHSFFGASCPPWRPDGSLRLLATAAMALGWLCLALLAVSLFAALGF